jgi:hypothetical protein
VIVITATGFLVGESPTLPGGNRQVCIMHFPLSFVLVLFYFIFGYFSAIYYTNCLWRFRSRSTVEFDLWGTVNVC